MFRPLSVTGPLAGLFALVLASTLQISNWTLDRLLQQQSQSLGFGWARDLTQNVVDLPAVFGGEPLSEQSRRFLNQARRSVSMIGYKVFDASGYLRLAAEKDRDGIETFPELKTQPNSNALAVLLKGQPLVDTTLEERGGETMFYADVYIPIDVQGRYQGVLQISLDQTEHLQLVKSTLGIMSACLILLATLAFGVPAFAFLRRSQEKRYSDDKALFLARHDPMTGLLNRNRFAELLAAAIADHRIRQQKLAILCIDLDRFKGINDSLGHETGDDLIVEVAHVLRQQAGPDCLIARLGSDEFAVAKLHLQSNDQISRIAGAILHAIARPQTIKSYDLPLEASIGLAVLPCDGEDLIELMKNADLALRSAKEKSGSSFVFYEAAMNEEVQRRWDLERRLRSAVADDTFDLHFQPLIDARSGKMAGFEALLRLPSQMGDFVSPAMFVPIAEDMGLISHIGNWVIRRACSLAAKWPEELNVAVNLSPTQFRDGDVCRTVRAVLADTGLAPHRLELEITEGLFLNDSKAILEELSELKALGVSIVMDDFGTGYSSLSYLWKFPFDKIKIDRSFMRAYEDNDAQIADILQAIVSLGSSLHMHVTAEGVETRKQAEFLRSLGCDEMQGFYFGYPMPAIDVAAAIMNNSRGHGTSQVAAPLLRAVPAAAN